MEQPTWSIAVDDINGNTVGIVPYAWEWTLTYQLNNPTVVSFRIPITSTAAGAIEPGSTFLRIYRRAVGSSTNTLVFYGPVWIVEESGTNSGVDMISVTALDPMVYLTKRFTTATFSSLTDQGTIIKTLINTTNSTDGDTGIRTTVGSTTVGITRQVDWSDAKLPIMDVITQFGDAFDGCDTWLEPIEYDTGKIADLRCADVRGELQSSAIFGYGNRTVANCPSMTRTRSMENVANDVTGYVDAIASQYINTTSVAAYKRLMADVSFTENLSQTMLNYRTQGYLDLHDTPDSVAECSFTAGPRGPKLFDDFDVGDFVPIYYQKGDGVFYAVQRVYSATISVNENNRESFSSLETRTI